MRAVLLEVPQWLLDERRRNDADRWDEVWEGELHMVPPPQYQHNKVGLLLLIALSGPARSAGLDVTYEAGLWATAEEPESYRIPDISVVDPARVSARGIESLPGRLLAIEIRSPDDEAYLKLPFYGRVGVTELVILDTPAGVIRRYRNEAGTMQDVGPVGGSMTTRLDTVPGVTLTLTRAAPGLRVDLD